MIKSWSQGFGLPLKASWLTVPLGSPLMALVVEMLLMYEHSAAGDLLPSRARRYAPSPATCGEAMDVPEIVF